MKGKNKNIALLFVAIVVTKTLFAQIQPRSTQNMYNIYAYNPAYVADGKYGDVSIIVRQQMMGFVDFDNNKVAPNHEQYAVTMPILKLNGAINAAVVDMSAGAEKWGKYKLAYSQQFKAGDGVLGVGLQGIYTNTAFDFSLFNPKNQQDQTLIDLKKSESYNAFDVGAGVFYRLNDLYFGLSAEDILQSKNTSKKYSFSGHVNRHFFLIAGYEYQTARQDLVLKPSFMYKNAGKAINQASLNVVAEFKKKFFGGLVYTTGNDISGVFGVHFQDGSTLDGVRAGVSWDFITSSLAKYGPDFGSLEVMVGYSFRVGAEKQVKSYKSVRFL